MPLPSLSAAIGSPSDIGEQEAPIARVRERRQRVQAAETGMAVLKGLGQLGGRAGLSLLAGHVEESPAKVHRYLVSLMEAGLVAQDAAQQYYLATESLLIGLAAMRQVDPIRLGEAALIRLRETLEVTCFIAIMGNKGPTIVRFEEPGLPVTVNVRVGSVVPLLWSATGRMFLAQLDEPRMRRLAEQELAVASREQRALLHRADPIGRLQAHVHREGCAAVTDTNLKGISAIAAPLRDYSGRTCGVLTALGATGGFDPSPAGTVGQAVRREAAAISALLGYAGD